MPEFVKIFAWPQIFHPNQQEENIEQNCVFFFPIKAKNGDIIVYFAHIIRSRRLTILLQDLFY